MVEPIRHGRQRRRDTSLWPTILGILVGSVIAVGVLGGLIR